MRSTRAIAAASLVAALAGCATTEPAAVLAGGPRMIEIYRGTAVAPAPAERGASGTAAQVAEPSPEAPRAPEGTVPEALRGAVVEATCRWGWLRWRCEAPAPPRAAACACGDAPSYARTAANELELLFPRLPNPDVYIYVPAHLATELRIPVPGYTTAVPLYDRVEYALPGESDAVRSPSEAPPGAIADETRPDATPEEAGSGASPEKVQADATPEEVRPGANPEEAQSGANPEVWPGARREEVPPGVSPDEAGPDARMEEAP